MIDEDPLITMNDVMRAGYCPSGARRWFRQHDLDFRDFMQNGVKASVLLAVPDNAIPMNVVAVKQKGSANG